MGAAIEFITVAGDHGFNRGKFIFNGKKYVDVPNVIAKADFTDGLANPDGSVYDWLKVEIESPALSRSWGPVAIGNAAYSFDHSYVAEEYADKYLDDKVVLMNLAVSAAYALESGKVKQDEHGIYRAKVFLSTCLPMREYKRKEWRQQFVRKFLKGPHIVRFLNTVPSHASKTVVIEYMDHIELNPEGLGFHTRLKLDRYGNERDLPRTNVTYVGLDIGGGTSDQFYMKNGEQVDPDLCRGYDLGINVLLDDIKDDIVSDPRFRGYKFQNRDQMNQILLNGARDPNGRYFIEWFGELFEVTEIVTKHLTEFVEFKVFPVI